MELPVELIAPGGNTAVSIVAPTIPRSYAYQTFQLLFSHAVRLWRLKAGDTTTAIGSGLAVLKIHDRGIILAPHELHQCSRFSVRVSRAMSQKIGLVEGPHSSE